MATMLSHLLPDRDMWPMIVFDGYIPIAEKVASLSSSTTQSLMVLLDPADAEDWELHTQQVYADQGRPAEAGVSDFGFGVWKNDKESLNEDQRVHDIAGQVCENFGVVPGDPSSFSATSNQKPTNAAAFGLYVLMCNIINSSLFIRLSLLFFRQTGEERLGY